MKSIQAYDFSSFLKYKVRSHLTMVSQVLWHSLSLILYSKILQLFCAHWFCCGQKSSNFFCHFLSLRAHDVLFNLRFRKNYFLLFLSKTILLSRIWTSTDLSALKVLKFNLLALSFWASQKTDAKRFCQ